MVCQSIYDANDQFAYALTLIMTVSSILSAKTDPLGHRTEYAYDPNKNRIYECRIGTGVARYYTYDYSNA